MSTLSEIGIYNRLESGDDLISHEEGKSSARSGAADALGSRIIRLRDDSAPPVSEIIGEREQPISKPSVSGKKGKGRKSKKSDRIKGVRGIDTLLRNAYRAQLEMLSLAAVKANIMISLNGLLMSMLIISGAHFISVDVWFSIPIGVFLLSSALATIFAVLAARPDISTKRYTPADFKNDKAHLLVFEEFSDLTEKQYVNEMTRMLGDNQRVYQNMISHVHELGSTADRKYQKLYWSYTVFIGGIILSVMSLLILAGMKWTNHLPLP